MKTYRPYSPEQAFLLPPSPREWLPDGHLAYFILGLVRELDLRSIERVVQAKDPRGERPYSPEMMTSLLLYAYATGIFSSRRIERACIEDVAFRVLASGAHPHFTTVNEFRATHLEALGGLFVWLKKRRGADALGLDFSEAQVQLARGRQAGEHGAHAGFRFVGRVAGEARERLDELRREPEREHPRGRLDGQLWPGHRRYQLGLRVPLVRGRLVVPSLEHSRGVRGMLLHGQHLCGR